MLNRTVKQNRAIFTTVLRQNNNTARQSDSNHWIQRIYSTPARRRKCHAFSDFAGRLL